MFIGVTPPVVELEPVTAQEVEIVQETVSQKIVPEQEVVQVERVISVDERINTLSKEYGIPASAVKSIIRCESGFKPNAKNHNRKKVVDEEGNVHWVTWSTDHSYFQINDYFWSDYFAKIGLDIRDPDDNLVAGFIILSKYGYEPWKPSRHCHGLTDN